MMTNGKSSRRLPKFFLFFWESQTLKGTVPPSGLYFAIVWFSSDEEDIDAFGAPAAQTDLGLSYEVAESSYSATAFLVPRNSYSQHPCRYLDLLLPCRERLVSKKATELFHEGPSEIFYFKYEDYILTISFTCTADLKLMFLLSRLVKP